MHRTLGMLAVVSAVTSCGPALKQLETDVPKKAAVAVTDEEMRQRYADFLTSPQIEKATEELSTVVSRGIVQGLSDEQLVARLRPVVAELTRAIIAALAASTRQLNEPIRDIATSMTTAVLEQARTDLPRTLAPAIAETLRDPEVKAALGGTTQKVTHEAVKETGKAVTRVVPTIVWLTIVGAVVLLFAVPLAWLLKERAATKRLLAALERPPAVRGDSRGRPVTA